MIDGFATAQPSGGRLTDLKCFVVDGKTEFQNMILHRGLTILASIGFVFFVAPQCWPAEAEKLPLVADVEFQPLAAQVKRVTQALELLGSPLTQALELLGSPLTKAEREGLERACAASDPAAGVRGIQEALDPLCLAMVEINAEGRVAGVSC